VCEAWLKRTAQPREVVLAARISTLVLIGLSVAVMTRLGSIQEAWQVSLLFGAGLGPVLVLRWLWERINAWSEVGAMAVSLVAAPLLLASGMTEWAQLLAMALASIAVTVLAALAAPPTCPATLDRFYAQVRPVGWWRATAHRAGDHAPAGRRAFLRDAGHAAACAGSMFLVLAGTGTLVLGGAGSWTPWLALAAGVALTPAWWAAAVRHDPAPAQKGER